MTRRRFATPTPKQSSHSLAERLSAGRAPLDVALSIATELIEAVASAHQQRHVFGSLSSADFVVQADGSIAITALELPGAETASNTFDVGSVLYQVFTGLTPKQARAQLHVSPLHDVPAASRINPALDDTIEGLLEIMLDRDPNRRPHSLRVIEALLIDVCESLDLEPSRASILAWAQVTPALRVVTPPAPVPDVKVVKHTPSFVVLADEDVHEADEEDDEDDAPHVSGGWRFDSWTAAACAFCIVAFTMATRL
jgi:hypothetical protein